MNNMTLFIVIAAVAGVLLGIAIAYLLQQRRTQRLKDQFGEEYGRVVAESANRHRAEDQLVQRQKRVEQFHIRPLSATEQAYFRSGWREVQARFVDDPGEALEQADKLIAEVMSVEGYPVIDFAQRAADISVNHSTVTENYREGHNIALRRLQGKATTEELRKAMLHYRTLFNELTGPSDQQFLSERTSWLQTTKPH